MTSAHYSRWFMDISALLAGDEVSPLASRRRTHRYECIMRIVCRKCGACHACEIATHGPDSYEPLRVALLVNFGPSSMHQALLTSSFRPRENCCVKVLCHLTVVPCILMRLYRGDFCCQADHAEEDLRSFFRIPYAPIQVFESIRPMLWCPGFSGAALAMEILRDVFW